MRWLWIDRIVEIERGERCVAVKNVSLAEDVLHDHFPAVEGGAGCPVLPNTLIIEGMAQTAGVLVGHARDFSEKVILAKIGRAKFSGAARPGMTLRYTAKIERIDKSGASTSGTVELIDSASGVVSEMGEVNLMFSHIDNNRSGLAFAEHNFVFTGPLMDLLKVSGLPGC